MPTATLLTSDLPADTVQLADPAEPQALLAHLRTAAAVPGPLLIALVGVLTADRRRRQLHLALARTRPDNARYTALPWSWLATELRDRPVGSTTVLADLVADKDAWAVLTETGDAALTADVPLWGQVSPPGTDGETIAAPYTRALVELLRRSTGRSTLADLHLLAVSNARLSDQARVLGSSADVHDVHEAYDARDIAGAGPMDPPARTPPPTEPPALAVVPLLVGPPVLSFPLRAAQPPRDAEPVRQRSMDELLTASAQACRAGDLGGARRLAREAEEQAARAGGAGSAQAVAAREARAHLAHQSGDLTAAATLWRDAAEDRLALQVPDDPQVQAAVDNAHACWARIADPEIAADLGPALLALRRKVPGPDGRALLAAERTLERLLRDQPGHWDG